jgi:hypothetical protein
MLFRLSVFDEEDRADPGLSRHDGHYQGSPPPGAQAGSWNDATRIIMFGSQPL